MAASEASISPSPENLYMDNIRAKLSPGATRGSEWIIAKYFEAAGIEDASVHPLRHTFGTHMVKNSSNLRTVQDDGTQGFSDDEYLCVAGQGHDE